MRQVAELAVRQVAELAAWRQECDAVGGAHGNGEEVRGWAGEVCRKEGEGREREE